ncbi:carboxypeptidase M32 [Xylanibacillus composti]|uniref:Metal-dependent carboxypeptidase n=1 Tax=Xylanibacillus composti TaxID=1572762 RepID=A0A8J4M0A8_9BACL|nr:carboxypeptidase M32 [Xylanibacillus composti]MDT9725572.1 carboxypeptidase M32 [Xylanibacillus composti]GIQ67665.1 carboxypeptidase M32 [Xylanibacillus composti]
MHTDWKEELASFRQLVQKMKSYEEALGVMYWDLRTGAPRRAVEGRSAVIGMLSGEMFKLQTSPEMGRALQRLSAEDVQQQLEQVDRKMVEECKKEYERSTKIPQDRYEEFVVLTSQAESVWEDAKEASDFAMFLPYLEKIIAYTKEFIERWGYEGHPYNALLDQYEPGMTTGQLDKVFGELRSRTVPLLQKIASSPHQPDSSFLKRSYDKEEQRKFSHYILEQMGYDFAAGRLDESVHPFATGLNPGDVRITTSFRPDDISFSLFSTIHEGGHALYEQNLSQDLMGTVLCTGTSMGIHESQSRFWENKVGRSRPFWRRYFKELQQAFPGAFDQVQPDDFYRAINVVQPSLIRIEADELTYNLHVMIRYELEKALFGGELQAAELPEAWNAKYEEYLGVKANRDAEGVLQDVHWAGGAFGYFPSYSLGNMYAAQIYHAIQQSLPDFEGLIERGELHPIKDWLSERIYRFGKLLTPAEVIQHVTGEPLNPQYLADYLEAKYKDIYRID